MAKVTSRVFDTPRDALAAYIDELETNYYDWYARKQVSYARVSMVLRAIAVSAGLGTAIVAALLQDEYFKGFGWGRIILVVLPIVGSFASTLLAQTRAFELASLREQGRETIQYLVSLAKTQFAAIKDDSGYTALHQQLVQHVHRLEQQQHVGFLSALAVKAEQVTVGSEEDDSANRRRSEQKAVEKH